MQVKLLRCCRAAPARATPQNELEPLQLPVFLGITPAWQLRHVVPRLFLSLVAVARMLAAAALLAVGLA